MDHIGPAIIIAVLFLGVALIVNIFNTFRMKRRVLEAGKLELEPEQIKALYAPGDNKLAALKWGLIAFCSGIGLIIIHFLPFGPESPLPWGIEITCVAAGFLGYYFLATQKK